MLTYDNSAYSNKEYAGKRGAPGQQNPKCYFSASLRSEVDAATRFATWTPVSLRERQTIIAEWAMRRWHVEPPEDQEHQAAEDELAEEVESVSPVDEVLETG